MTPHEHLSSFRIPNTAVPILGLELSGFPPPFFQLARVPLLFLCFRRVHLIFRLLSTFSFIKTDMGVSTYAPTVSRAYIHFNYHAPGTTPLFSLQHSRGAMKENAVIWIVPPNFADIMTGHLQRGSRLVVKRRGSELTLRVKPLGLIPHLLLSRAARRTPLSYRHLQVKLDDSLLSFAVICQCYVSGLTTHIILTIAARIEALSHLPPLVVCNLRCKPRNLASGRNPHERALVLKNMPARGRIPD